MLLLVCVPVARHSFPGNVILLSLMTVFMSLMLGTVSAFYATHVVAMVLCLTTIMTLGLVVFTLQSKVDFSVWGAFLFAMVWVLNGFGILRLALPASDLLESVYCTIGAAVFGLLLCYDVQRLVANAPLLIDEYVLCVLSLELDVFNLFLFLLRLVGGPNRG